MKRRRSKPTQLSCIFSLCSQPPICRMRLLLLCLCVLLAVTLSLGLMLSDHDSRSSEDLSARVPDLKKDKLTHRPSKATAAQVKRLVSEVNWARLWYAHLQPILIERPPGSRGSRTVRRHVSSVLDSLSAGWSVQIDSFNSETPRGPVNFSNILAVLDPLAPRRLLLACHYDTKNIPLGNQEPKQVFVGASDSAVPCAMMLELVTALDSHLKMLKQQEVIQSCGWATTAEDHLGFHFKNLHLSSLCEPMSMIASVSCSSGDGSGDTAAGFFDGAEAFEEWTSSDSLYGSRHLAEHMSHVPHPPGSEHTTLLHAVDLFILLALIGGPSPTFVNHFANSARWFDQLVLAEKRLHSLGLLSSHPSEETYFRKDITMGPVDDDHTPFLQRGVPVLHIIATPFPSYRHTVEDNADKIHSDTVENLTKVLVVFLAEYLGL